MNPECPYCGDVSKLTTGEFVYPHRPDLGHLKFYVCIPCDARVGCHGSSSKPLGRLANGELRSAKSAAHAAFDPLWKRGTMKRTEAYAWLSEAMGLDPRDTHIGMFDIPQCNKVIKLCEGRHEGSKQ